MNNSQSAEHLKKRIALIMVLSILNFVAAPLYPRFSTNVEAAPLNPVDGPTAFIRRIPLPTNDLVYSKTTGKIYASVPSSVGDGGNSIAAIDPTTGVVSSSTFIGSEPGKLALSDDDHTIYVWLEGSETMRRFEALTNTPGLQFSLGRDQRNARYLAADLAVAPGNPSVLAVVTQSSSFTPAHVAIFDDGVRRPNVGPSDSLDKVSLAFSATASKLYSSGPSSFQTMTIDASGVAVSSTSTLGSNSHIEFVKGLIFTSLGQVIDPDSNTLVGTFAGTNTASFVADTSAGRAYYLTSGSSHGTFSLEAFDIANFKQVGSLAIAGADGAPTPLIRWGANGLAFRTYKELFIIQTSLIPSVEPVPDRTPAPSPAPSPSPSPTALASVRTIALRANDLVFNEATQKLYASVPSSEGSTGNSIAEIDPVSGSITNQTFVGSEPTHLAMADDGATLYVGLEGAASIRSYNMLTNTAGAQFSVGRHNADGPYTFSDIAVSPGNPQVVAVARQSRNPHLFPPVAGVAIFDNGVQRPNTGPSGSAGSWILAFASPTILYGDGAYPGLTTMSVDNSGVSVTGAARFVTGPSMILAGNLLYSSLGQVINPATGELEGRFPGMFLDTAHAIDPANGRAFFVKPGDSGIQIKAYDLNTFLLVGFINIPGITGVSRDVVRWGKNGLAFRTYDRQLVLVETALVDATVDVPGSVPSPSPSPTPSPSPPNISTFIREVDLPANSLVFSEATQALYASVPSGPAVSGDNITKINPQTGEVGPSVFIGNKPNRMAISNDGQTIWVHLDGANAARRFDVLTETAGLQFATGNVPPADMEVVPGSPQSVVLSRGQSGGVAIYDNGIQRPSIGNTTPPVGPIEFGANASVLYGYNSFTTSFDLVKFLVDSSGALTSTITPNLFPAAGESLKLSNGLLYTGSGHVVDPESGNWVGKFQFGGPRVIAVDAANHRVFTASTGSSSIIIRAFDANTFLPLGSITIPGDLNTPLNLVRWGANGLAFTANRYGTNRVYLVQSRLVSDAVSVPTGIALGSSSYSTHEAAGALQVQVVRTGDETIPVSVNYATSDFNATAGSDYIATSGTLTFAPGEIFKVISIPIINDSVYERGQMFHLTLSNPTNSAVLLPPATAIISIESDEPPSIIFGPSPIEILEGDSGMKNLVLPIDVSPPSYLSVSVDYDMQPFTAQPGSDYIASSGTLTVPPDTRSAAVTIPIVGDTTVEPNEIFFVAFRNPTNAPFLIGYNGVIVVQVTVKNDDASVQLSNAAFSVNEGSGFATVTVTREGDTSRAAIVHYSTTDSAGMQNCTLANGKASERCDYGTAMGRLQFAIGETSKTFIIPIVDDALVEGDETFTVTLSSPAGAFLGQAATATISVVDNDSSPAAQNPIDNVSSFVTQQYIDFLGRLPDTIGLANWTNTLGNCPNGGFGEFDNPACDRVHVSAGFFLSDEFRGRGYFAYKFYEVGFDRRPAYAEFVPDMALVGGPQSPESEALNKALYAEAFMQRQEFRNRYDALSNSAYVDALESNAEVTLTGKAALVAALDANQKTRAQVLREIVELQPVTDKFFVRAFVAMQYFGYLRRDPDTIGYDNWIATMTADPSNFRHIIFGFIYSDEYRRRFGP